MPKVRDPGASGLGDSKLTLGLHVMLFWFAGACLAILTSFLLAWIVLGVKPLDARPAATNVTVADIIRIALLVVGGMGGVVALVVAYRRQRHLEADAAGRREDLREFNSRYSAVAEQIGNLQPAVRLAGIYGLANLADQWIAQRQQCIDLLCGYLRLSPPDGPADADVDALSATEKELRRTIVAIIRSRLQSGAAVSWSELDFDLRRARLPYVDFGGALFRGDVDFSAATLGPDTSFSSVQFAGSLVKFEETEFSGQTLSFEATSFGAEAVSFKGAKFRTSQTTFKNANWDGCRLASFEDAKFEGDFVELEARFSAESTGFVRTVFACARTDFAQAEFVGNVVAFQFAKFEHTVSFAGAQFRAETKFSFATFGGTAEFKHAVFASAASFAFLRDAGWLDFDSAKFSGPEVSFSCSSVEELKLVDAKFDVAKVVFDGAQEGAKRWDCTRAEFRCDLLSFRNADLTACNFSEAVFACNMVDVSKAHMSADPFQSANTPPTSVRSD